jgi:Uma2 family endonuclease
MTLDEWADLPEDEEGELVDGLLVEEEMPTFAHEAVVAALIVAFSNWGRPRGAFAFGSETKQRVGPRRGRKPDAIVYLPGAPRPRGDASSTDKPPSIVVEVVTARPRDGRRDRVEKRADYAAFGVRWYWIVDPQLRTLEVFELVEGRYVAVVGASSGRVAAPGCDGLEIDLDAMWAQVDALLAKP